MPGTVPTGVAQVLLRPPIALLTPILDEHGPYAPGNHTVTDFLTTVAHGLLPAGTWPIGGTYGVLVSVNGAIPAKAGFQVGYDSGGAVGIEGFKYFDRFAQVVVMHQALSGAFLTVQIEEIQYVQQTVEIEFIPLGGDRLGLFVAPNMHIDLFFLCLLA